MFDIRLIRDTTNLLGRPVRQTVDDMAGLFPQYDQPDIPATVEVTEAGAWTEGSYTDATSTSSAPPLVQSVSPRQRGMPPGSMMVSQATWTEVVIQLAMLNAKVSHIEGGVTRWIDRKFNEKDRKFQESLDAFKLRITQYLGRVQAHIMADIRFEIAEIKKMAAKLYERLVVTELVVKTMIPIVEVPNIQAYPDDRQVEEIRYQDNKRKKKRKDKKRLRRGLDMRAFRMSRTTIRKSERWTQELVD